MGSGLSRGSETMAGEPFDRRMMGIALSLARRGLGNTAPNPAVGAVIADETTGEIVGRGWTQPGGRPHAEPVAIARAGARARGATMYVTLEPCSHHGRTPPCADAIVSAGLKRVVCAIGDPDPRVAGRGLDRLRSAGIAVTRGVLAEEARWTTRGHILRVTERRPFVQLKLALGSDGNIARGKGAPTWVTGPEARARGHLLRAQADAILIGRGTLEDDDPDLTCRLPGLSQRSPARVILAGDPDVLAKAKMVRHPGGVPVWAVCDRARGADADSLSRLGIVALPVPRVGGRLWLPALLEALVGRGITRLLVEGGPTVWRAFAQAGLADEIVLFHATPDPIAKPGGLDAQTALHHLLDYTGPLKLTLADHRAVGSDQMLVFRHD